MPPWREPRARYSIPAYYAHGPGWPRPETLPEVPASSTESSVSDLVFAPAPRARARAIRHPHTLAALAGAAALAAGAACRPTPPTPQQVADGDDPVAALTSSTPSTRYTQGYWLEQMRADSAGRPSPWRRALAYCGENGRPRPGLEADGAKPNCFAVSQVEQRTPAAKARLRAAEAAVSAAIQRTTDSLVNAARARR